MNKITIGVPCYSCINTHSQIAIDLATGEAHCTGTGRHRFFSLQHAPALKGRVMPPQPADTTFPAWLIPVPANYNIHDEIERYQKLLEWDPDLTLAQREALMPRPAATHVTQYPPPPPPLQSAPATQQPTMPTEEAATGEFDGSEALIEINGRRVPLAEAMKLLNPKDLSEVESAAAISAPTSTEGSKEDGYTESLKQQAEAVTGKKSKK